MKTAIPCKNVVLIGFKGSGKSRIGKLLAKKLGYEFMDIDTLIENEYRKNGARRISVRTIYKKFGRDRFLGLEAKALRRAARAAGAVISLGGGSPMNEKFDRGAFKDTAFVHLDVRPATLFARIMRKGIPPFFDKKSPKKSFTALYRERTPTYARIADLTVDNTKRPPALTCREIVAGLGGTSDE